MVDLPFPTVFANSGTVRDPTPSEQSLGFPCGPADRELFNGLFKELQEAINALAARNGDADIPVLGWQSTPPSSPSVGDRYLVAASPTGAWAGQANKIAIWLGAWAFSPPRAGLQVQYYSGRQIVLRFTGSVWEEDLAGPTAAGRVDFATIRSLALTASVAVFSTAGIQNWTVPANISRVRARVWGAGGGGGQGEQTNSAGAGGNGGAYAEGSFAVTPGQVIPITVGAAGLAGNISPNKPDGTAGGSSSFGAFVTSQGGPAGRGVGSGTTLANPNQATATGGQMSIPGGLAAASYLVGSTYLASAGAGSFCSGPSAITVDGGIAGAFPGGGGSGSARGNGAGNGAGGLVILEY